MLVIPIDDLSLMYVQYLDQTGKKTRLNEEDTIFFIQNPDVTAKLKNARNDRMKDVYKTNDAELQVLEREYGLGVELIKYHSKEQYG